jgi:glutaredoxin-like protein NrdH
MGSTSLRKSQKSPRKSSKEIIYPLATHLSRAGEYMNFEHVAGLDKGRINLYALSTCIWCKKTKELLSSLGVAYNYIYVDLLKGAEREEAIAQVKRFNPSCSFPTLVLGESRCIIGFREKDIREALQ